MEKDKELKRSWTCYYCHPYYEVSPVVPDQQSLEDALRALDVKFSSSAEPIKKPPRCKLPSGLSDHGDEWICRCQMMFDDHGVKQQLEILVYLNWPKYLEQTNVDFELEDENHSTKDSVLEENAEQNYLYMDTAQLTIDTSVLDHNIEETRYVPMGSLAIFEDEDDGSCISYRSNISNVSQMALLHGSDSDTEIEYNRRNRSRHDDNSQASNRSSMEMEFEQFWLKTSREMGIPPEEIKTEPESVGNQLSSEEFERLLSSELGSQGSAVRGRENNTNNNYVNNIVEKLELLANSNVGTSSLSSATPLQKKNVEIVDLSTDSEAEGGRAYKKRKKVSRRKDVPVIDLKALGLVEKKDNYIRLGEVQNVSSCFCEDSKEEEANAELLELRKFRSFFREQLKSRVERREHEKTPTADPSNLSNQAANCIKEIKMLRMEKESLETADLKHPTNPMERSLLMFMHPVKVHGMPTYMYDLIMTPYKLALLDDEIDYPNEWSEDLPFQGGYFVQDISKTEQVGIEIQAGCESTLEVVTTPESY